VLLLRLGFKKTKYDPDLCIVDNSSQCEYLTTYIDDILIWSKNFMTAIKSIENILIEECCIPEYCLGGNEKFLGDLWKNQ
jgi:hypothetical protein